MNPSNKNIRLAVTDFASSDGSPPNTLASPGRDPHFKPLALRAPTHTSIDLDDYFVGPRDVNHHSKWPYFLRLHGSVLPKMVMPLFFVGGWATAVTLIDKCDPPHVKLGIQSTLLTITGFVVSLALSFRSTTAYERYSEGRRYWSQLVVTSRNLARLIWIHIEERHAESDARGKADLLAKLTALNLVTAFAVALKHRLRWEPATDYPDLQPLIGSLHTLAGEADQTLLQHTPSHSWKATGEYLGITFAQSNPRKLVKRSRENLGNVPLEILTYLSTYLDEVMQEDRLKMAVHQTHAMNHVAALADVLTGTERILNTPIPIAYSICISQITWVYILTLPFQLLNSLGWVTIFGTVLAAYIILGFAAIGYEIENPFGNDVNDLPLDTYCRELASDLDVLTSMPAPKTADFIPTVENAVLFPLSRSSYASWSERSMDEIRAALRSKATTKAPSVDFDRAKAQSESTEESMQVQAQAQADADAEDPPDEAPTPDKRRPVEGDVV